ncbi:hypothetical protein PAF17_15955 [Paracoccus sp. Z330]|uniref:Uncharacterized protein n=1 Tax=Paracoccus onchidii TaxID=3017813 RepID=A0ABT4ZI38_9RHOB|nr:hypothetical protein [Paracoccus onchidii]MDB6178986.1 hypothetical protein [Paracoccus onchidii]
MAGTVNISRDLWHDEAFAKEPFSEREAWIWMICEASWKSRRRRVGDFVVDLKRGELSASVRFMADIFGWHRSKVHRFLQRLTKLELIAIKTETGVNVISICKYNEYQNGRDTSETDSRQDRDRTETKQKKGERREKEGSDDDDAPDLEIRERVLSAMGVRPDGVIGPSKFIGGTGDMSELRRWLDLPNLTPDVICAEVARITARKRDGPPSSFTYFTEAMRRLSGQLSAPALKPIEGTRHDQQPARDRRASAADDAFVRVINAAAGTIRPS